MRGERLFVLSNVETAKSYVVAIILYHAFLLCCAISAQYNYMFA